MGHIIGEWLMVIAGLFIIIVIFFSFDNIIVQICTMAENDFGVNDSMIDLDTIPILFRASMLLMAVGLIFYGFVRSQKEEPTSWYYEGL